MSETGKDVPEIVDHVDFLKQYAMWCIYILRKKN